MSTNYTPGPWRIWTDTNGRLRVGPSSNYSVAEMFQTPLEGQEANSRRIVACVNACEGMSTEALENITFLGDTIAKRFRYRNDVEETLIEALEELERFTEDGALKEKARAAIAKANGEQP